MPYFTMYGSIIMVLNGIGIAVPMSLKIRHSTDPDDPQISEQISEKISADVAVPGYPDPWHPDPLDADMASATSYIRGCSA